MNNGHFTGYFPLKGGIRQGDPISAFPFILALEILLIRIRQNEQIKGICISDHELKISAYADDANFLVRDIQSLNCLFPTCTDFGNYSSLTQVNGSRQISFARCIMGTRERREIQCRIHGKCKQ